MSNSSLKENSPIKGHIQNLPIEVVSQICSYLSIEDVLSLTCVSKIWRCVYINQNIIWKNICKKLNIKEEDYKICFPDASRSDTLSKLYIELNSQNLFGPICKWWSVYNRYNMILKNIKDNNFPTVHVPRGDADISYCTDDYIINVNRRRRGLVQAHILKGSSTKEPYDKTSIKKFVLFSKLLALKEYNLQVIGNKKFLVFEIHSIIFVYSIFRSKFRPNFIKIIERSVEFKERDLNNIPEESLLMNNCNTKIDLFNNKLALLKPNTNTIFVVNLTDGRITKQLIYSKKRCIVNCMKFANDRLMIGIGTLKNHSIDVKDNFAIVYHLEEGVENDTAFTVPLFGAVTQFKVSDNTIGVENQASQTPFITKNAELISMFWLDCDTFSFDYTRKYIYYNINRSIFQYDFNISRYKRFEVTQKIAVDAISNHFSLTPINDRYLLVSSIVPNSFDLFDVKTHISVKSIQLSEGFDLVHVGKLSIVFSNSKEFVIVAFY